MTTVTISDEDPRSIKAVEIAATAGQWLRCRTSDGVAIFGVPSQCRPGRYHLTTVDRCDCQDAGRRLVKPCKHVLAVRLHAALANGSRTSSFVASHMNDRGETVYLPRRVGGDIAASQIVRED